MAGTPRPASPFPIWCQRRRAWIQETTVGQRQSGRRKGQSARVVSGGCWRGGRDFWLIRSLPFSQGKWRPGCSFFFFVVVTQNQMFYFFYLNQSFKIMYICFWPFSKKLPRSQSWKKQSLNLSHWKSVRRVWRRRTFGPWRPKKQTWRPKERLTEKVSHLLFSRESLHLSHVWQGFLQTFGIQTKQLKQCFWEIHDTDTMLGQ